VSAALDRAGIERWLAGEFAYSLAAAIEAMAGAAAAFTCSPQSSAPPEGSLLWRQPIAPLSGAILTGVAEESWTEIGRHILSAASVEGNEAAERKSACLEVIAQAFSGVTKSLTGRLQREVTCADGIETAGIPTGGSWTAIELTLGATTVTIAFGPEPALLDALELALASGDPTALPDGPSSTQDLPTRDAHDDSRTFDLLLDVELPVSVSFGHAQVLLKDVLKLTTGSIVELDRAIVEPVDIKVNNCVIARGEVVVVEGNFGVRIQHVVSREERVRTLR
jgi:flagellar motor switch protein FliN/FliY